MDALLRLALRWRDLLINIINLFLIVKNSLQSKHGKWRAHPKVALDGFEINVFGIYSFHFPSWFFILPFYVRYARYIPYIKHEPI